MNSLFNWTVCREDVTPAQYRELFKAFQSSESSLWFSLAPLQHQKCQWIPTLMSSECLLESEIPLPLIYTVNSSNFCIPMTSSLGTSYLLYIKSWPCFPWKTVCSHFSDMRKKRPQEGSIPLSGHQGVGKVISQIFRKRHSF